MSSSCILMRTHSQRKRWRNCGRSCIGTCRQNRGRAEMAAMEAPVALVGAAVVVPIGGLRGLAAVVGAEADAEATSESPGPRALNP